MTFLRQTVRKTQVDDARQDVIPRCVFFGVDGDPVGIAVDSQQHRLAHLLNDRILSD